MTRHLKDLEGPRKLWFGLENCLLFLRLCHPKHRHFCWFLTAILVSLWGTTTLSSVNLGKKLYQYFRITGNITKAWVFAKVFWIYLFIFFHFPDSGLSLSHRIDFHFWWSDSDNRFKGIGGWIKCSNQINFFFSSYESSYWFLNIQTTFYICG